MAPSHALAIGRAGRPAPLVLQGGGAIQHPTNGDKLIKGRSSRLLRQEFRWCRTRLPSLWTNSYFVSTVGGAPLEIITQYIEQRKHV